MTSVTYEANGTQKVFSIPFDYLRGSFVYVNIGDELMSDFEVINRTVELPEAPPAGSFVRIFRSTPTDRLVSWADASVLKVSDMTIQQVQQLHIVEENTDWIKVQMDSFQTEVYDHVDGRLDDTRQEIYERLSTVIKEVDELVNSLNSASKEELLKISEEVKYYANIAEAAALINCHWPIGLDRERDPKKPTYGLDNASLVLNVPQIIKLEVTGDSNPSIN